MGKEGKRKMNAMSAYFSELGRKGGSKGGTARQAQLSPKERSELARSGAKAKWEKQRNADTLTPVHKKVREMLFEAKRIGAPFILFLLNGNDARFFRSGSEEADDAMEEYGEPQCVGTFGPDKTMTDVYNDIMEM
jgi:hypothetical protein